MRATSRIERKGPRHRSAEVPLQHQLPHARRKRKPERAWVSSTTGDDKSKAGRSALRDVRPLEYTTQDSLTLATVWNWLLVFEEVGARESIRAASRQLRLSPSTVTRTIQVLEEHLGVPLFARKRGRLKLNPAGQKLLSAVHPCATMLRAIIHEVGDMDHDDC